MSDKTALKLYGYAICNGLFWAAVVWLFGAPPMVAAIVFLCCSVVTLAVIGFMSAGRGGAK